MSPVESLRQGVECKQLIREMIPVSTSRGQMAAIKSMLTSQLPLWTTGGQSYWELWEQSYAT